MLCLNKIKREIIKQIHRGISKRIFSKRYNNSKKGRYKKTFRICFRTIHEWRW